MESGGSKTEIGNSPIFLDEDKLIASHTLALVALCFSVIGPVALATMLFLWEVGVMGANLISFWLLFVVMIVNFVLGIMTIIFGMKALNISKGKKRISILATWLGVFGHISRYCIFDINDRHYSLLSLNRIRLL
jgi:hypothetical protein